MKPIIVPTVFVFDRLALEERLELYESLTDRVQLDVADEEFSVQPSLGVGVMIGQPSSLKRDAHLMVNEPIEWLEACKDEAIEMVVGQIETMSSQQEFVDQAKEWGLKVGLAVDLETEVKELEWEVTKRVDQILIMAVRAGKEQQQFDGRALEKVQWLRDKGFEKEVCVDGGVNEATIKKCVRAGADILAVGSALWKANNVEEQFNKLNRLAGGK